MCQQDKIFVVVQKIIYNTHQMFTKTLLNGYTPLEVLLDNFISKGYQVSHKIINGRTMTYFFYSSYFN